MSDPREAASGRLGLWCELVLVRHGQTPCSVTGRFCGTHDTGLTEIGHRMAEHLGHGPALDGVGRVVTSPSLRARQTAEAIAAQRGLPSAVDDRLRELSFGEWEDVLPADVAHSDEHRQWTADPALFAPPGGETGLDVMARAVAAVRDAAAGGGGIAVVTHKAVIRLVMSFFLRRPPSRYRELTPVTVGSVTRIEVRGDRAVLRSIGDVSHLPRPWRADPDKITGDPRERSPVV
ncbi:hypothetical protein GCM10012275_26290 [Longimycelium tulufanense]|uniref:Phosphoglycerate mutase n=1 Tax=Longimycelium tulufanense TaxID=907463 RepID=A0A8J3C855_9PSEU|nr:histidine phosphatase family protein [Longimycelium tulufanense]GGM53901.1 hypothetical protein GCM10012275_26290 [Longimycelium tulufanense]